VLEDVEVGALAIGTRQEILVLIKPNGSLEYGPNYTPDAAATIFWEAMGQKRLEAEDRILVLQHMEAVMTRLGVADLQAERLRRRAALEEDESRRRELDQLAELGIRRLELICQEAIELGRALAGRDVPLPAVPEAMPDSIANSGVSSYQGRAGLPPELALLRNEPDPTESR
jgi:hypothetical protein